MSVETKKRIHVYYSGRVHGVGFRFTCRQLANELGLNGWVKNLPDGRVEFVAEGKEDQLQRILDKIEDVFSGYIRQKSVNWMSATGEFESFEINFF